MGQAVAVGVAVQETEKQVEEERKAQGSESVLLTGVDASL